MTAEENNKLFLQLKEYDKSSQEYKEIRDKIYSGNIGLVYKAAYELNILKNNKYDYEDAIQTGKMGLFISIDKFDVDLGNTFSTFAFHYAKGFILDWLNRDLEHGAKLISYDKQLEWEDAKSLKDYLSFKDKKLENARKMAIDLQKLSGFLKQLNENQRKVIQLRYLSGEEIKTFEQISKELGITRQAASYMEIKAISKIKDLWQGKGETRQGKFALIQQYVIKNKKYLKYLSPEMATILRGTYIENNYLSSAKISAKLGMKHTFYVTLRDRALKDFKKVVTTHENGTYNSFQKYLTAHKTQLEKLSKIEQQVLELRYLGDGKKNNSEIADRLGITTETVSDIEQRAFKKLIQLVHDSKTKNQQETQ